MTKTPYKNRYIWIIGASTGIGRALAIELASQGATLILTARSEDKLNMLNKELGEKHCVHAADTSHADQLLKIANKAPKIDSVIFMAAIYSEHSKKTKEIGFIHDMINVNLGGAFNTTNAVLSLFKQQGHGQIALCGSVAGYRGLPHGQPYCATKSAIISYAESLKIELKSENIDVKVINPGFVKTPLTDKNNFPMPMMIEAEQAAKIIAKDLQTSKFEIHFPKKFTYLMKIVQLLPNWLYFYIMKKIMRY